MRTNVKKKNLIRYKLLAGIMAAVLTLGCFIGIHPQEAQAASTDTVSVVGTYDYTKASEALTLVNKQRSKAGVSQLTMDKTLMEEAMSRAAELCVYMDGNHTRPNGKSWNTHYSKLGSSSAENCNAGQTTASQSVNDWVNSPKHKTNMLNSKYKYTGIGCFTNNGVTYWVQVFSSSAASSKVKSASGTKNMRVTMNVLTSNLKYLTLSAGQSSVDSGKSITVNAYLKNKGTSAYTSLLDASKLTWSSGNTAAATVNSNGRVTGKSAGSAKITAKTSKGTAKATTTIKVNASATNLSKCTITLSNTTYTYDGKAKKPGVTVKYNGKSLTQGKDYTLSYSNNVNVGTGKVTVTGKGSYTGSVTKTFTIKKGKTDLSKCTITLKNTTYAYTGKAQKPAVTVKYGSKTLKEGTDYTVSYSNNVNVGTGKVTVTGKGDYTGSVTKTFTIKKEAVNISKCMVTLSQTSYVYDGKAKKPTVTVIYGDLKLKEGTDYTVTYSNNVNPGTAKAVVTAKGGNSGTATKTFTITKAATSLSGCTVTLSQTSYTYDGKAKKPTITVKYGSKTLKEGTDYTVTYKNNVNPGSAEVTVTGKGDYSGSITRYYVINPQTFSSSPSSGTASASGSSDASTSGSASGSASASGSVFTPVPSSGESGNADAETNTETTASEPAATEPEATGSGTAEPANTGAAVTTSDGSVAVEKAEISDADRKANPSAVTSSDPFGLCVKSDIRGTATLFFQKVSDADGYEVMYSNDKNFPEGSAYRTGMITINDPDYTEFRLTGLSAGETFYFKVRYFKNQSDGSAARSGWGSTATITVMQ